MDMVDTNTYILLQAFASVLLVTHFLWMAGKKRGIFEAVLIFDSAKYWFGPSYARKEFTDATKDVNHDGKVSYWERTFPKDGGHRTKLKEVIYLALAAAFTMLAFWRILRACMVFENIFTDTFLWLVAYPILLVVVVASYWFLVFSYAFDRSLKKHRYPPKRNDFDEGDIYSPPPSILNF